MSKHNSRLVEALDKADSDNLCSSDVRRVASSSAADSQKRRPETTQKPLRGNVTGLHMKTMAPRVMSPEITNGRSVIVENQTISSQSNKLKRRLSLPKKKISLPGLTMKPSNSVIVSTNSKRHSTGNIAISSSSEQSSTVDCDFDMSSDASKKGFAVCSNCGIITKDFQMCERCKCKLPKNPKMYIPEEQQPKEQKSATAPSSSSCVGKHNSFYRKHLVEASYNCPIRRRMVPLTFQRVNGKRTKNVSTEPPVLTLSSDEELQEVEPVTKNGANCSNIENNDSKNVSEDVLNSSIPETEGLATTPQKRDGDYVSSLGEYLRNSPTLKDGGIAIQCRSIRFGSYKIVSQSPVGFMFNQISMKVSPIEEDGLVTIQINGRDILKVISFLGHPIPVMFFKLTLSCSSMIRTRLNMYKHEGPFYDSGSEDDTLKWVVLLPESIQNNQRSFLKMMFDDLGLSTLDSNGTVHCEVDHMTSNELLIRSAPLQTQRVVAQLNNLYSKNSVVKTPPSISRSPVIRQSLRLKRECKKLATYPPPPHVGGITVTSEDMKRLVPGELMNDVLIDFYLKFLFYEKLSQEDRCRTYIFSSFFYKRLTNSDMASDESALNNTKPSNSRVESAVRRHSRVKTWTRHVDLFEKDFIIIPVNENAHWFLAVICFAYLVGEVGDEESCPPPSADHDYETDILSVASCQDRSSRGEPKTGVKEVTKNERISPEIKSTSSVGASSETGDSQKRPCILIFDSLGHRSSWNHVIIILREYLSIEFQEKKNSTREFSKETIRGSYPKAPQQTNHVDCGLYVLQYVESFFEKPIKSFKPPIQEVQKWFSSEHVVKTKRKEIKDLIMRLHAEQQPTNNCSKATAEGNTGEGDCVSSPGKS